MKNAVVYYRVSSPSQGKSGLGLEAQQYFMQNYVSSEGFTIVGDYTEVISGKKKADRRTMLRRALNACRKLGATLLIANIERLGRNLAFTATLMESRIKYVFVEYPFASEFELHIKACFAHKEGKEISARTSAALQAAKRRGVVLGKFMRDTLSKRNKQRAEDFALSRQPDVACLQQQGFITVRALTEELNKRKIPTYTGKGKWHTRSVFTLLKRIERLMASEPKEVAA